MNTRFRSAVSVAAVLAGAPFVSDASAQEAAPALADAELSPLVVTPGRTAQTVDDSVASVSVIDRETIQDQQPKELADLLQGQPGVSLTRNGPFGKNTSVFMRGTESDHTVLLVDGVRMTSATTGGASWEYLSPQEIDRVEVVRGPRASIYGADAIGGVIQVFTREGEGEPRVNAFAGAGRHYTYQFGAGVRGQTGDTRYALSGNRFHTDGINVREDAGDDDPDGLEYTSFSGRVSQDLPGGQRVYAGGFRSAGDSEFDSDPAGDVTEFVHQAFYTGSVLPVTTHWETELRLERSEDRQTSRSGSPVVESVFDTLRHTARWRNEVDLGDGLVTWGVDHADERVTVTNDFEETERYNTGAYAQAQRWFGPFRPAASLRYDYNEVFPNRMTGQAALAYEATRELQFRGSYGTAYKAPSFNDLYFPNVGFFAGNPDLEPETSRTAELGARYRTPAGYWDVAVFRTEIDDLIENQLDGMGVLRPTNVSEALIEGGEIERLWTGGPWRIRGALTYVETENRETGERLARRPRASTRASVDRDLGPWRLGVTGIAESRRVDGDQATSGYGVLNLRARYRIDDAWSVRMTLDNATDEDYELVSNYQQPGRSAFLSVHYDP